MIFLIFLLKKNVAIMAEDVIIFIKLKKMEKLVSSLQKNCLPKFIRVSTGNPSYEHYIEFTNNFSRRNMTEARIEGSCKKVVIKIG